MITNHCCLNWCMNRYNVMEKLVLHANYQRHHSLYKTQWAHNVYCSTFCQHCKMVALKMLYVANLYGEYTIYTVPAKQM